MKSPEEIENELRFVDWQIMDILYRIESLRYEEFLAARQDYLKCSVDFEKLYFDNEGQ